MLRLELRSAVAPEDIAKVMGAFDAMCLDMASRNR